MSDLFDRVAMLAQGSASAFQARRRSRFEPMVEVGSDFAPGDPFATGDADVSGEQGGAKQPTISRAVSAEAAATSAPRLVTPETEFEGRPRPVAAGSREASVSAPVTDLPEVSASGPVTNPSNDRVATTAQEDRKPALARQRAEPPQTDDQSPRDLPGLEVVEIGESRPVLSISSPRDGAEDTPARPSVPPAHADRGGADQAVSLARLDATLPPQDREQVRSIAGMPAQPDGAVEGFLDEPFRAGESDSRRERQSFGPPGEPAEGEPLRFADPLGARAREVVRGLIERGPVRATPPAPPSPPPSVIEVTIGRLEIRAASTATPPKAAKRFAPHVDLAAYRTRRDRGE